MVEGLDRVTGGAMDRTVTSSHATVLTVYVYEEDAMMYGSDRISLTVSELDPG